jgi:hypothetical protein
MPDNKSHLDLFMNLSTSRNMRIKIWLFVSCASYCNLLILRRIE